MIEFKNVAYAYDKSKTVLKDFSLNIKKGECVLLIGASGCGKSTVLKMINGLIPHFYKGIMRGEVTVCGKDIKD